MFGFYVFIQIIAILDNLFSLLLLFFSHHFVLDQNGTIIHQNLTYNMGSMQSDLYVELIIECQVSQV